MHYTFAPHLDAIASVIMSARRPGPALFALVDGARATKRIERALRAFRGLPTELVFEDSFAKSALNLSPMLVRLSDAEEARGEQMLGLDQACSEFPMLTFVGSELSLKALTLRLRQLLLIEAERSPYLMRFADTQMLVAANSVLTPSQRSAFFDGIDAWFTVDFGGKLDNAADRFAYPRDMPAASLPIALHDEQTSALIDAVAIPMLASRLANLDSSFASALTHAQRTAFAARCIADQADAPLDDGRLVSGALKRWHTDSAPSNVFP